MKPDQTWCSLFCFSSGLTVSNNLITLLHFLFFSPQPPQKFWKGNKEINTTGQGKTEKEMSCLQREPDTSYFACDSVFWIQMWTFWSSVGANTYFCKVTKLAERGRQYNYCEWCLGFYSQHLWQEVPLERVRFILLFFFLSNVRCQLYIYLLYNAGFYDSLSNIPVCC